MSHDDANKLRNILIKLDITNATAAKFLGISIRTMYRYLSGEFRIPKMVFLALSLYKD
jgi:DNA-binding XRE family transcriptional regulator